MTIWIFLYKFEKIAVVMMLCIYFDNLNTSNFPREIDPLNKFKHTWQLHNGPEKMQSKLLRFFFFWGGGGG